MAIAERIVLEAARVNTTDEVAKGGKQLEKMRRLYLVEVGDLQPHAFLQLTDNWIELSVRFLVSTHGVRATKDRIARKILAEFELAQIELASQTFELVHAPQLTITREKAL